MRKIFFGLIIALSYQCLINLKMTMKLRTNLFLIFGGLLFVLLLVQWWVITSMSRQIRHEVEASVFSVSRDTAEAVVLHQMTSDFEFISPDPSQKATSSNNKHFSIQEDHLNSQIGSHNDQQIIKKIERRLATSSDSPEGGEKLQVIENVFIELKKDLPRHEIRILGRGFDHAIEIQNEGLDKQLSGMSRRMLSAMSAILILGLIAAAYFAHRLSRPLQKLTEVAHRVGEGEVGEQVHSKESSGPLEIQTAIEQFNNMSRQLQDLERRNSQLQDSQQLSELGEIARGFAHSLRNPLNTLGLAVDELATADLEQIRKQDLHQMVLRQIARIDQWIKSFMSLNNEGNDSAVCLKIAPLVENLVLELKSLQPKIQWQLTLDENCQVEGHETELNTMLQVLLENALEASKIDQTIKVDLTCHENTINLKVVDEGSGIEKDLLEQLFSPKVTSKRNGAGMGLFLARRLARGRYQGDVELLSDEKGTTAQLTLLAWRESIS